MKIYLDNNYKCHISKDSDDYLEYETDIFDGKCQTYIEGYRIVPLGETWTREDGRLFSGEMIVPCHNLEELERVQTSYEMAQLTSQNEELITTIAKMVEDTYQEDLATIGEEDTANGTE